ncbi:hypothetical protein [Streptomyces spiramenti]|uniref:Nuclear transport factor 2 family protein n=1 Tax=Streptomyces spiramenti TaxID=2720606 RepID=A0ABX1AH37_9ACTN|nr:hypothetical protein [Streptomyces spiramenti]NJP65179.1 hypothetical protein [Streptomyces spiramenti]
MLRRTIFPTLLLSLVLTGCGSSGEAAAPEEPQNPGQGQGSPAVESEDEGETDAAEDDGAESDGADQAGGPDAWETPEEAYRSWLTASRLPDAELACGYLTDELVEKMLAEMEANGYPPVSGCEELTEATAEMYRAFGVSDEVTVEIVSETHTTATLFVTYVDGGDCGTIDMERTTRGWVITDQSEECAA